MKAAALQSCESSEKAKRERYFAQPSCLIFFKEKCAPNRVEQCDSEKRSHKQLFLPAQTDYYSVSKDKPFPFVSVRPIHQHRRVKATQGTREETLNTTNATWCPAKTLFLILLSLGGVWHSKILKTHGHTSQSGCSDSCLICLLAVGTCYRQ